MITLNTNKIMIPIDFSETSRLAIKHGAFTASLLKGELLLVHVVKKSEITDVFLPLLKLDNIKSLEDKISEKLNEIATDIRKEYGIKVETLVSTGRVPSEIRQLAADQQVGLIVMGTHGHSGMEDWLLGSNTYRVLSKSSVPVLAVRNETSKLGFRSIVLPIDSSDHSRQKVNATIALAKGFSAKLHVLGLLGEEEKNYEPKMNVILSQVKELAEKSGVLVDTRVIMASQRAAGTIQYCKEVHADLVVTMNDQNVEFSGLLLGPYAQQLINHAQIPVLVFPAEVHEENIPISVAGIGF